MDKTVDERIFELGTELKRVREHEKHRKGASQKIHEELVTLRAAKWISLFQGAPVGAQTKPDTPGSQAGSSSEAVDLVFPCGGTRYVLEHTTIESFEQQRRWTETGVMSIRLPEWDDLAQCRKAVIRKALERKLPKLNRTACEERSRSVDPVVSVLLMECEDYWHSKPQDFLQALAGVLPEFRERLPDQIHLAGTVYFNDDTMTPEQEGNPTGDQLFVLDLADYRTGAEKPTLLGHYWWCPEDWSLDWVVAGSWGYYPF